MRKLLFACLLGAMTFSGTAQAATILTEDFEAVFPAWESGWLATNSNLTNYYGVGAGRGNNPDGLWIGVSDIIFDPGFGQSITSISFDVAGWSPTNVEIYDSLGGILLNVPVFLTYGAYTDPGTYVNFSASSLQGIGGFRFTGGNVLGNTSIDNVIVELDGEFNPIPEPATLGMFAAGLGLIAVVRRRR
jgi:hypothetical protein